VAPFTEFMGYTQPWYSVRGLDEPVGGDMGYFASFLRDADDGAPGYLIEVEAWALVDD